MFVWIVEGKPSPVPKITPEKVPRVSASHATSRVTYDLIQGSPRDKTQEVHFTQSIMTTPVVTIDLNATLKQIETIFIEKRFRHLPVVDANSRLIGILSDRDFWKNKAVGNHDWQSFYVKRVLTAKLSSEIHFCARIMLEEKIGCLPVVNENQNVVGIITRSDILRTLVRFPGISLHV